MKRFLLLLMIVMTMLSGLPGVGGGYVMAEEEGLLLEPLSARQRVEIWVGKWRDAYENGEQGMLLRLDGESGVVTAAASSRGPESAEMVLVGEKEMTAQELAALDRWIVRRRKAEASGANSRWAQRAGLVRLLTWETEGGMNGNIALESAAGSKPEKTAADELSPVAVAAEIWQDFVMKERARPFPDLKTASAAYAVEMTPGLRRYMELCATKHDGAALEEKRKVEAELCEREMIYRHVLADALCHAGRVQILHLQTALSDDNAEDSPITYPGLEQARGFFQGYRVNGVSELSERERLPLIAALQETLRTRPAIVGYLGEGYDPRQAVRVWNTRGELVYQGGICLDSKMITIGLPGGGGQEVCYSFGLGAALWEELLRIDERDGYSLPEKE